MDTSPMPIGPEKRSLNPIGEMIDQTIKFYQAHWKVFAPILVIGAIPSIIIEFVSVTQGRYLDNSSSMIFAPGMPVVLSIIIAILAICNILLQIWTSTAVIYVLKRITEGQATIDFESAFKNSLPFIIPLTLTELITGLIVAGGFILLIIPGIIFLVWGFAVAYIYMFENIPYYAAFQRSRSLVSDHWFDVFWRLAVMMLIIIGISIVAGIIPIIGALVTPIIVTPIGLYYAYLLYTNLKQLKEPTAITNSDKIPLPTV